MNLLQIDNKKGKIKLNDVVHKDSADKLIDDLGKLYGFSAVQAQMVIGDVVCAADDALESVEIQINSPGGSVFEGYRIYNALRDMSARGVEVVTTVDGTAASMGSVILMAGDKRQMAKHSRIMIHEASSMAAGDARQMRKTADLLEGISDEIAGIYSERTGGDKDKIRDMMLAETWMDAATAKANGFVHEVLNFDKKPKAETAMNILAKLFPDNSAQIEQIEAAIAESDALRVELETVKAEITNKDQVIAEYVASIATKDEEINNLKDQVQASLQVITGKDEVIAELQSKSEVSAEKVAEKASELLAQTGHPAPVNIEVNAETRSIVEIFESLTGSEAAAFYKKHKKEITAALKQ